MSRQQQPPKPPAFGRQNSNQNDNNGLNKAMLDTFNIQNRKTGNKFNVAQAINTNDKALNE